MGKVKSEIFQDRIEKAYDKGDADAYYGRRWNPSVRLGANIIEKEQMSPEEIKSYNLALKKIHQVKKIGVMSKIVVDTLESLW